MKALVVDGEWCPREKYPLTEREKTEKRALVGSQVWKNPSFAIRDVPTPDVKDNDVLIRVKACGICGSDTHVYETDQDGYIIFSGLTRFPCILGHEFSGVIEKTGKGVSGLKKGDFVAVESVLWCGKCHACKGGTPNQCTQVELMGLSTNGAFAEYVAVNERHCWKINDLKDIYSEDDIFDIGALIEPAGCAYNGLFIAGGGFKPGSNVVIYGAGPIGLSAIAMARVAGAGMIIAFDLIEERVKLAKVMGADYAFNINNLKDSGPSAKVMELTRGWGVDVQVEAAGAAPATIPEMEKTLSSQGKIIYLGRAATNSLMYLDVLVSGGSSIVGSRGHVGYGIYSNIIRLIRSGRLDLKDMITSHFQFDDLIDALMESTKRRDGKIMVNIG